MTNNSRCSSASRFPIAMPALLATPENPSGEVYRPAGVFQQAAKGELLDELERAIEDRRLTVITYQSLRTTEPVTLYDIHPYALVWHKRALYLIAWSCDHNAIRTFKLDRLSAVNVQQLPFQRPTNFNAATYLAGSLGIFQSDAPLQTILIRFSPQVARSIQETTHHPSQQLSPQPDGTLLAQFELSSLEELQSWILSYGAHAEVLEPETFREKVVASLRQTLLHYETQQLPTNTGRNPSRPRAAKLEQPK